MYWLSDSHGADGTAGATCCCIGPEGPAPSESLGYLSGADGWSRGIAVGWTALGFGMVKWENIWRRGTLPMMRLLFKFRLQCQKPGFKATYNITARFITAISKITVKIYGRARIFKWSQQNDTVKRRILQASGVKNILQQYYSYLFSFFQWKKWFYFCTRLVFFLGDVESIAMKKDFQRFLIKAI